MSVLIHAGLGIVFFYFTGLIFKIISFLNQDLVIDGTITIAAMVLFFYTYSKLLPEKYESHIALWSGFFPVLLLMMYVAY
ncbi:hypothetical protein E3U55_06520 [Filobacillus milosensis]|uniref:Uncharacterized protein n=1 Tax=Filobacillus milosensis TaxID=94137 RepID=A0A4Y8INH9_9BACI|nr:hypothetical protein E3U55_06520 [Filobacillus milosensis]